MLESDERGELRAEAPPAGGDARHPYATLARCHCSRMARDHHGHAPVRSTLRREHQERKGNNIWNEKACHTRVHSNETDSHDQKFTLAS